MGDFPNEILLQVFSFLPLKSLITSRTVSQEWRRLIPLADITPIRRALLNFYLTLIDSPIFPQTRPWVLANLQPFDRQQYLVDTMIYPCFSEAFHVWILEWPAKAVIGCVWPGLPDVECAWQDADNVHRIEGTNELKLGPPPPVYTLSPKLFQKDIHALRIFHNPRASTFLVMDLREHLYDQIFTWTKHSEDHSKWDEPDVDWIGWQKRTWGKIEAAAKDRAERGLAILRLEDMSPCKEEDNNHEQEPWRWAGCITY